MMLFMSMIDSVQDQSKFEKLYKEYRAPMFHAAYQILKNREDAEDAVHQAFVSIAERIEMVDDELCQRTKGYCITIAENKAIDLYRHKKRNPITEYDEHYMGYTIDYDGPNAITRCIAKLPALQREILLLKYLYGFSSKEVAEHLDLTEANVIKISQRAKKQLQQICIQEGIHI